ncbi:hypothetical protein SDC9_58006 [bioreactor metagenome]|uniref:MPN domain-containing protein n=1 Tax=bioreactor metagenome TaxID=1076179 RepID=A0A644X664_9ZZZZ
MTTEHYIGHRKRLRDRFEKSGFNGFHDYEVLEFLLTYIFKQIDVKPLAKELLFKFGSFSNVLDAPIEELENINGMGKVSALGISAFREIMAYYYQSHSKQSKVQITKMSSLIEILRANIGHKTNEVLFAVFLNAKNEVLASKELGEGTVSQSVAFPRKIIEESLKHKASSVILAHNHPGGIAHPSSQDELITEEIKNALALVDINLQDHIILADNEYYSFKRSNSLFKE